MPSSRQTIQLVEPNLFHRKEQPYAGIRKQVRRADVGFVFSPLLDELSHWLAKTGVQPAGVPFLRVLRVDTAGMLEVDVGIPIAENVSGEGQIISGTLPAGTYAMALHVGHPEELEEATAHLLAWAEAKNIHWKMDGSRWAGRVEWYYSDLGIEPDLTQWETELAFLTDDS